VLSVIKQSFTAWADDRAPAMGAALAFYGAFSIAPLLVLVTAIAGLVFGVDQVRAAVIDQAGSYIGASGARALGELVSSAYQRGSGPLAATLGIAALLAGATSLLVEIQTYLDIIWRAKPRAGGFQSMLRSRATSIAVIAVMALLLLATLVCTTALTALSDRLLKVMGDGSVFLLQLANTAVSLAVTTAAFAMLYKWIPAVRIAWRDVWIGAAVTAVLFMLGHIGIGLYLKYAAVGSAYGAAGTFVVLLMWIYYSAQIFLLGAEFTAVYARSRGSKQPQASETPAGGKPQRAS